MEVSYKRKDETSWVPAVFSGFDPKNGGGWIEPMGTISVETIHGIGCDICSQMDPPFLRMETTRGDEEVCVSACLGCVRLALKAHECDHNWDAVALGPYSVVYECSKCEATRKEAR
jgi:hypothetical protein